MVHSWSGAWELSWDWNRVKREIESHRPERTECFSYYFTEMNSNESDNLQVFHHLALNFGFKSLLVYMSNFKFWIRNLILSWSNLLSNQVIIQLGKGDHSAKSGHFSFYDEKRFLNPERPISWARLTLRLPSALFGPKVPQGLLLASGKNTQIRFTLSHVHPNLAKDTLFLLKFRKSKFWNILNLKFSI